MDNEILRNLAALEEIFHEYSVSWADELICKMQYDYSLLTLQR